MRYSSPPDSALEILLKYEVGGGKPYYDKYLSRFTWPGAYSGPTIGIGIDCAYYSEEELREIFKFLPSNEVDLIVGSIGKTGQAGKAYAASLREKGVTVDWDDALDIFKSVTWKKFSRLAEKAFPGLENLCEEAYSAIVSLVFNRGAKMSGSSRLEMRNIKVLVPKKRYDLIAEEILKMKRLWENKNLNGLLARRDAEAALVRKCE